MSTTLVVTPAEAQPAAPNFQQIQKQIDATTRNALMNLWGPYEQLIRTFPQLKPVLDPLVAQFLPPRKPVAGPRTTANSLFNAINAGVDTYNRAHPVPTGGRVFPSEYNEAQPAAGRNGTANRE